MFIPSIFVAKVWGGQTNPEEVLPMGENRLTWRDVLDNKREYAFIGDMAWAAVEAGYHYFVWEDVIYKCMDNVGEVYVNTGIHSKDLA